MMIKKKDKSKTVFGTRYRHFKYQVMFFRMPNALASFEGFINKIFAKKLDIFVIFYLDNIVIYTQNQGKSCVNSFNLIL